MSDFSDSLFIAASGMRAQTNRLRFTAENIANVDTPGYRGKTAPFSIDRATGGVEAGALRLNPRELPKIYDPAHPMADAKGYYQGSNVDLMIEIADAREAQRSYEANLKMFEQARQMSASLMELLRK